MCQRHCHQLNAGTVRFTNKPLPPFSHWRSSQFLYAIKFILFTDQKPLLNIFSPHKATPALAVNRLARWAVTLSQYDYSIEYRQSSKYGNADALSRLPSGPDTAFDEREGDADMDSVYTVRIISTLIQEWWPEKPPNMQLSRRSWDIAEKAGHHAILQMKTGGLTQCTLLDKYKTPSHVKQGAFSMGLDWSFQQVCNIKCYTSFIKDTVEWNEWSSWLAQRCIGLA